MRSDQRDDKKIPRPLESTVRAPRRGVPLVPATADNNFIDEKARGDTDTRMLRHLLNREAPFRGGEILRARQYATAGGNPLNHGDDIGGSCSRWLTYDFT